MSPLKIGDRVKYHPLGDDTFIGTIIDIDVIDDRVVYDVKIDHNSKFWWGYRDQFELMEVAA